MTRRLFELNRRTLRSSLRWLACLAAASLIVASISSTAPAAFINHGTFLGSNVTFVDVTESSPSGDPLPLFGAPTASGNTLDFNPNGFAAFSANGGSDITDGNLTFMVTANQNSRITGISFNESGDTTLAGIVPLNSLGTATMVRASGVIDIHEVNFVPIDEISIPFALAFNPSNGDYFLGVDGLGGPFYNTQWTGSRNVNLIAALLANNIQVGPNGGATKISVDLDNTLAAASEAGTSALIAKKDFGVKIIVEVPEPTTLPLAGLALAGIALRRSRKSV